MLPLMAYTSPNSGDCDARQPVCSVRSAGARLVDPSDLGIVSPSLLPTGQDSGQVAQVLLQCTEVGLMVFHHSPQVFGISAAFLNLQTINNNLVRFWHISCSTQNAGVELKPERRLPYPMSRTFLGLALASLIMMSGNVFADSFTFLSPGDVTWNGVYVNPYQAQDNTQTTVNPLTIFCDDWNTDFSGNPTWNANVYTLTLGNT